MHIRITTVGKPKFIEMKNIVNMYLKRITHYGPIELLHAKNDSAVMKSISEYDYIIALDEHGKQITSKELSKSISRHMLRGTKKINFIIGGANGIKDDIKSISNEMFSMSRMTLQHDIALLVLMEQIYRAFTILKGEPYHRA